MKKLGDIVTEGLVVSVQRGSSVAEAALIMGQKDVGILAVLDGDRLVGLFSERDVVRRVLCKGLDPKVTRVEEVMTSDLVVAEIGDDYMSAMRKMDGANIRHLPVVREQRLTGMVSVRDLLRVDLESKAEEIRAMHDYLFFVTPENAPKVTDKE